MFPISFFNETRLQHKLGKLLIPSTVGIRLPKARILETFDFWTNQCPVFEWLDHYISGQVINLQQPFEYRTSFQMVVRFKIPLI
jgi:hypothetical protein